MAKGSSRGKILAGLAVLLALFAGYAFHRPLLTALGGMLVEDDPLQKCDAAVVLSGEPGDGLRTRAAVKLYKEGWVRKIVLSGARGSFNHHESDFSQPLAISLGVPRDDTIAVPHSALSTLEEVQTLAPQIEQKGLRSIIVVTSNYHTRRAARYFRRVSRGRLEVRAAAATDNWFFVDSWWHTREGLKTFFYEFTKQFDSVLE